MRKAYKILRNLVFGALLTLGAVYVLLYAALSVPAVQDWVKRIACDELNSRTGGRFEIEDVDIAPFNRVVLKGVSLRDPKGDPVAKAEKIGAGIAIWRLILEQRIIITFGEIVGLDATLRQDEKGGPTNIQFLIDAFASKDKKPPKHFDLQINNIVLRNCKASFRRRWMPTAAGRRCFNPAYVQLTDINADLRIPILRNDHVEVDLRRLSLKERSGLDVESLSGMIALSNSEIAVRELVLKMPGTLVDFGDISVPVEGFGQLPRQLLSQSLRLSLTNAHITPADFSAFLPVLANYPKAVSLDVDASWQQETLTLERFAMRMPEGIDLTMCGSAKHLLSPEQMRISLPMLNLDADGTALASLLTDFLPVKLETASLLRRLGSLKLRVEGSGSLHHASAKGQVESALGSAAFDVEGDKAGKIYNLTAALLTPGFNLGCLLDNDITGVISLTAKASGRIGPGVLDGNIDIDAPRIDFRGYSFQGLVANVSKQGKRFNGAVSMADANADFNIEGEANLTSLPALDLQGAVRHLSFAPFGIKGQLADAKASGEFDIHLTGNNLDNLDGYADFSDLSFSNAAYPDVRMSHLRLESNHTSLPYSLSLDCDLLSAAVEGDFNLAALPASMRSLASKFLPSLVGTVGEAPVQSYDWHLKINHDCPLLSLVKMPVTLLEDLSLQGSCDTRAGTASMTMDVPYLQQGKDKLIRNTRLNLAVDTTTNLCRLDLSTIFPNKKGDIDLHLSAGAASDSLHTTVAWHFDRPSAYRGQVSLTALVGSPGLEGRPVQVLVNPSQFEVNDTTWHVAPGRMLWSGKRLTVDNVMVSGPGQMALISGAASESASDVLKINLKDIDLDYVFETLNINYVTFGGSASGLVQASALFSKRPLLRTDDLDVKALTYNKSLLGDALIRSYFDNDRQSVRIDADIKERLRRVATIGGDIFVTRDSLSLGINADSVNVGFLQPFMAAFCSGIEGRASGDVHLYGTFKDIDLTGRVHADTLRMKIDVTNTWYSACDSVIMTPGRIGLHDITLRDREGHTALLNGEVRHTYFHDPTFDFVITDAYNFLCYDTDASAGNRWWGTIYGNGSGKLHGVPGFIDVEVDMTSAPGSTFTFVLDDHEEAADYEFLTFTDRRKEAEELRVRQSLEAAENEPDFLKRFRKKTEEQQDGHPTRYEMDLRMTATPDVAVTIVMDPVAGDKISATGGGNLRMTYNSEDELNLYGNYTLDKGFYNFTLQDLIVRDFVIREGSRISFSGDPLKAILSLTAAYRVNTSLTELDKSFAFDRELNRTNVPVEALLKVNGEMQSPEITFDLDFPTLSADVAGKVRSIISTSDMMNRQIIYLLALNRFYTPDYMNADNNNNELASVASSTLSTQLGQMLGQLAPGWTFSPYFRTDKGDFSDMEVDLALSSALFNNRLLLNGNLGYRDRSTSNTTFVGDFDIEYVLNPSGTLRLKAYNHFNDQNYYLRSALTTQGLGIVYKRDFTRFLPGLFRRHRMSTSVPDSITTPKTD